MPMYAPSIMQILENRVSFLFHEENERFIKPVLEPLEKGKITLQLLAGELREGRYREGLRSFYDELIHALGQDQVLEELLLALHVGNVERTLSVFPSLINSKGIYMEYKDAVRQRDEKRDEREEQEEEGDGEIKDWPKSSNRKNW